MSIWDIFDGQYWRHCEHSVLLITTVARVRYCSCSECWKHVIVRYCPYREYTRNTLDSVRYTILPELRIFSGFDTAGTAVMWKDTSSIGNILGLCTAGYIIAIYVGSTLFGRLYSHAVRVLAALKYILSILPVSSEIHVHWDEHRRYFRPAMLETQRVMAAFQCPILLVQLIPAV